MLTLEDCMCLSELTEDEISAIAEHEHLPQIVAAEMGGDLAHTIEGRMRIWTMFRDDIRNARACGDHARSARLKQALRAFILRYTGEPADAVDGLLGATARPRLM